MNDRIEKRTEIKAPVSRVWKALTDYREFGEWLVRGHITYPGYEHLRWEATVTAMEPERLFAFTWHPYPIDPNADYSQEEPTLVEFRLQETPEGTLLIVTESGFDKIPPERRAEAFRMNDRGWSQQLLNVERHIEEGSQS